MTEETVTRTDADGVATITLHSPGLSHRSRGELAAAFTAVAGDPGVRAVVFTGAGRAFCVGQDLKEHVGLLQSGADTALGSTVERHYNPIVTALASMAKPVVAAVNGVAAGAGASLALACDLRIVSVDAGFNLAFAGVGLSCDTGSSWTLQRLVGPARALELLYLPRTVGAEEALELGLANRVVPAEQLGGEVDELATRLAAGPTVALAAIRASVGYAATHSLAESVAFEAEMMRRTGATADHRIAVEAFLAKQKPVFEGR